MTTIIDQRHSSKGNPMSFRVYWTACLLLSCGLMPAADFTDLKTTGGSLGGVSTSTEARIAGGGAAFSQRLLVGVSGDATASIFYGGGVPLTSTPAGTTSIGGGVIWTTGAINSGGDLWVSKAAPTVRMNDTGSASDAATLSYVSFQRNASEKGWIGFGHGANGLLSLTNTIGNIYLNASGSGTALQFGTGGSERLRIDATGNVGIGTSAPASKLDIVGGAVPNTVSPGQVLIGGGHIWSGANQLNFMPATDIPVEIVNRRIAGGVDLYPNGNVLGLRVKTSAPGHVGTGIAGIGGGSIGTSAPTASGFAQAILYDEAGVAHVALMKRGSAATGNLALPAGSTELVSYKANMGIFTYGGAHSLSLGTNNAEAMRIDGSGNIGIGTGGAALTNKLSVFGTISAKEIKVTTTGADYVFEEGYKLRSLAEVEQFIAKEKHLPEMMSAKEMQAEGMPISEVVTKQLAKIEELTLYAIQAQKERDAAQAQAKATQEQLLAQEARLQRLEDAMRNLTRAATP